MNLGKHLGKVTLRPEKYEALKEPALPVPTDVVPAPVKELVGATPHIAA